MKKISCICTILILAAVVNVAAMEKPYDEPWRFSQQTEIFPAGTAENVELVSITPGACYTVAVDGNTAYIGAGVYLLILDITDKSAPVLLGSVQLPDIVRGIAVSGGYAYVAGASYGGLRVVDVSNPKNPNEVGFYDTPGIANNIAVSDGYAYIADWESGLRVVDVRDPENPYEVGFYEEPGLDRGWVKDVAVSSGYAYITTNHNKLSIIDVSNPENPNEVGFYNAPREALGVAISDGYAYIASGREGLRIVDVSNPENPYEVGFYEKPVIGSSWAADVAFSDGYVYIAYGRTGLCIVDVRDATSPYEVGSCRTRNVNDVVVSGSYAYIADYKEGLHVIDINNLENPCEVGFYNTPGWFYDVAVSGDYAYILDHHNGLRVIDISNPENPDEVGFCKTPEYEEDVAVSDGYAYIVGSYDGLHVIDVRNPISPYEVGFYSPLGGTSDVTVSDGYAYIVDGTYTHRGDNGLHIVDVSNPENPYEVGSYETPGYDYGVAVSDGYAYIANYNGGLRIADVSNPENPYEVGSYDTYTAINVAVSGGYAYIADGSNGLRVVDVSNPENPDEVGFYDTTGYAWDVALSDGYACIAADNRFSVVDVSNPISPNEVGFYDMPGRAYRVAVANNLIYVANREGGMSILRFTTAELSISSISPSAGPVAGGTWVMIYGTNFKEGATVTIGGKDAINPLVDPIAAMFITAITPPGVPGPADVVVTNPDEESATLESGFMYIPTGDVSADGTVSAYDATLILQYVVGLITEFPIDRLTSPSDATPQDYELHLPNLTAKAGEQIYVPLQLRVFRLGGIRVSLDEVSGLFAGGVTIKYDANLLRAVNVRPSLSSVYHEANISRPGEIRFAFATAKPVKNPGELLMVEFDVMSNTEGKISPLLIDDAQFSESLSIARHNGGIEILPAKTALLPNYPNPFNPETWIPYQLSVESDVIVEIYNHQGRLVRVFDLRMQPAGSYLTKNRAIYWDGKNGSGERAASGVYFYRLKAEYRNPEVRTFSAVRKLNVVK